MSVAALRQSWPLELHQSRLQPPPLPPHEKVENEKRWNKETRHSIQTNNLPFTVSNSLRHPASIAAASYSPHGPMTWKTLSRRSTIPPQLRRSYQSDRDPLQFNTFTIQY